MSDDELKRIRRALKNIIKAAKDGGFADVADAVDSHLKDLKACERLVKGLLASNTERSNR